MLRMGQIDEVKPKTWLWHPKELVALLAYMILYWG